MKTLISFLGKGQADAQTGYRMANYRFEEGFLRRGKGSCAACRFSAWR